PRARARATQRVRSRSSTRRSRATPTTRPRRSIARSRSPRSAGATRRAPLWSRSSGASHRTRAGRAPRARRSRACKIAARGEVMELDSLEDVRYEVDRGLAWITIARPDRFNSFRGRTVDELVRCFKAAWVDREVGVVALTGEGDKAFCAGGDQKQ